MLDGFNGKGGLNSKAERPALGKGKVELRTVLQRLIEREEQVLSLPARSADGEVGTLNQTRPL